MVTSEKFGSHFGVRLAHKVFVHHTAAVASVVGDVLLTDLVGGTRDPVLGVTAASSKHVAVDALGCRQFNFVLLVTIHLKNLEIALVTTGQADLTVDGA